MRDERERELRRDDLAAEPIEQFRRWFDDARAAGVPMPEACAVATASVDAAPSVRMVLLKDVDDRGFVFATNYRSRKGRDLDANPYAALLFYWHAQGRQVRVGGAAEVVASAESNAIWRDRPRASRISALASEQSEPISGRLVLEDRVQGVEADHEGREVERPEWWGGYRVVPAEVEFWQHRADRLHHRFRYERDGAAWRIAELQP